MTFKHLLGIVTLTTVVVATITACSSQASDKEKKQDITEYREKETGDMIAKGKYLVTAIGCSDCHSPKKFTAEGPIADSTRLFSGHPAQLPLSPFDSNALRPGNWMQMEPDMTAYVGPWGVSFAANLTPDSTTGIGGWTEDVFVKTLRTGRHLGMENGRPLFPPMPDMSHLKEEDMRAIYAYLHSLPAVKNPVSGPLSSGEALKALKALKAPKKI